MKDFYKKIKVIKNYIFKYLLCTNNKYIIYI